MALRLTTTRPTLENRMRSPLPNNRLAQLLADNRQAQGRRFEVKAVDGNADEVEIFIYEPIVSSDLEAEWWGGVSPNAFVKALRGITASTIHLRINSPGGDVFGARAIETALREHKAHLIVHIDGLAASAATFIAMAGDEIVISPGAMFMIHKAWTLTWGNADDLAKTVALLQKVDDTLGDTYAARSGQDKAQILEWMSAETWFTGEEAVEHGFVDRLAGEKEKDGAPENQATWNLSAFLARATRAAAVQTSAQAAPPVATDPPQEDIHRNRQQQRLRALKLTPIV
ncbi:head maturation protease, ClpP-related [Roseateles sp.]|uniref:head maturation protease, ClpP-related n=1 Tax=Roseateles sp. TaxID=1971397 RepID=UPI002F41DBDA